LCLGFFEQMTRTTPRRLMTLQPMHIFFTDALTFKVMLLFRNSEFKIQD
jgi:hypothetical protein